MNIVRFALKIMMLFMVLGVVSCVSFYQADSTLQVRDKKYDDYSLLLSHFLGIYPEHFQYVDDGGIKHPDELKLFKALEEIYVRNLDLIGQKDQGEGKLDEAIRVIMFYAFYAQQRNSGAFNAYLASDLLPVYEKNRHRFLRVMSEHPFLISSVCNRLNAFFGFEGNNFSGKNTFVNNNIPHVQKALLPDQQEACLVEFE